MTIDAEMLSSLLIAFAGATFGALAGGAVAWGNTARERRLKMTLDLYAQFHTPEFNHLRILAHEALEKAGSMPEAFNAAPSNIKDAIASVTHFWERVALLNKVGALNERLAADFFGQYARWWGELLCDKPANLDDPEWGQTLRDINGLFTRFKRYRHRSGSRK